MSLITVTNVEDGETVHQTCLLLIGTCSSAPADQQDHITVRNTYPLRKTFTTQTWPAANGKWKALILLQSGSNIISIRHGLAAFHLTLIHQPLLSLPPLHLAILVAKDSPLVINCAAEKDGAISSAHNSLDAAISKLRMTAYMWQAHTAEYMRSRGLGRRVFRLEEEWQSDTMTLSGLMSKAQSKPVMGSLAKVHIVKCEQTVEQIMASMNGNAGHDNVAGIVLDTPWWSEDGKLLGQYVDSNHASNRISLASFGSHFTYSWPRFLEEISFCLTDKTVPDGILGEARLSISDQCSFSQSGFLCATSHAFGASARAQIKPSSAKVEHWAASFITGSDCDWDMVRGTEPYDQDLRTALQIKLQPHFRNPHDTSESLKDFERTIFKIVAEGGSVDGKAVSISSTAGLVSIFIDNEDELSFHNLPFNKRKVELHVEKLADHDRKLPLKIVAMDMRGVVKVVKNGWELLHTIPFLICSTSDHRLRLQSFSDIDDEADEQDDEHSAAWTVLLHKRSSNNVVVGATAIDLRVGGSFDGVVVQYADGTTHKCGPEGYMGGHLSEERCLAADTRIVKVELSSRHGLPRGIRMTLDNGMQWGALGEGHEGQEGHMNSVVVLEPGIGEKIIGFSGRSDDLVQRFGIITAPIEVDVSDISVQAA